MSWTCNLSKNADITVGEKLLLACDGSTQGLVHEELQLKTAQLNDEVPPLSLLSVKTFTPEKVELVVTSYRTGEHKSADVVLYDGKTKMELTGFDWAVKSILKQDPANPPQPFGSFPMISLSYPYWFWILLVLVISAIIGLPYLQYQRMKERKKAFDDLKNLEAALSPLDTFFKGIRRMEKALEVGHVSERGFADQIDKDFRVYLSRTLHLPAHIWKSNQTLNEIKKRYPKVNRDHGDDIKKYFSEFSKIQSDVKKKDCYYLMERAQKLTEEIDESLSQKKRGRK